MSVRTKALQGVEGELAQQAAFEQQLANDYLAQFDLDGDGVVDPEELQHKFQQAADSTFQTFQTFQTSQTLLTLQTLQVLKALQAL